jgi:formylglycine-generating enzyme required for sulfatase activity
MARTYDVFLCHSGKDKPAVLELALKLREKGIEAWLDKAELPGGGHWLNQAAEALGACRSCAFFVGPTGLGQWQESELRIAIERHVKEGTFPVIPVILPGGDPKSLPTYLNGYTWVAFPQTIDDEEAVHRFVCYIRGTTPGLGRGTLRDDNECPYRGLEFFDVAHAPYFHGREELIARLVEKLRINSQSKSPSRFLAIVGASGSGKSSLVRAGLVAAMKRGAIEGSEDWPVVICRPGADPCASVAVELARLGGLDLEKQAKFRDRLKDRMQRGQTALNEDVQQVLSAGEPKRRLMILVDQFEELFTICRDERLRAAFIDNLVNASQVPHGQTLVLLAMRADFYGKCATYPNLARSLSECQELIGPMTRDELHQAIEKPAQKVGCELEPGLVHLLLNDVVNDPGSLPFLQFALKELWNRRTGRKLTTEGYRAIGGVTGALKRKADEVYSRLSEPQQRICRRIFLRLTQPGEGTEDTKRRVPLSELRPEAGSLAEVEAVLFDLSEAETRLVTGEAEGGEEFFEVAHEALIRGWPELRTWIEADRAALLTQRRLTDAANEWIKKNRDASFLLAGARLATAREWAATHAEEINPLESLFISASRRYARRQRLQLVGALAAILVVVAAGWLWIRAQNIEQNNRTRAEGLVDQLKKAEIGEVPAIVKGLDPYRSWADPLLREEDAQGPTSTRQKLHLELALLPVDASKLAELRDRLPIISPAEFVVVRDFLPRYTLTNVFAENVVEPLWKVALGTVALDPKRKQQERFQAACALATYAPNDKRWNQINSLVSDRLMTLEASALVEWRKALRPAKGQLIAPLTSIFRDAKQKEQARIYAAETLADYSADRPDELFNLLADAEHFQFSVLFERLAVNKDKAVALAKEEIAGKPSKTATESQKETLAQRQANAAVALLQLGAPERVWPILKQSPDPTVRSSLIHRISAFGGDPQAIIDRYEAEPDVTIRRSLVLALGEFTETQLPPAMRQPLIEKLLQMYENEPDAGLHGAAEWLLRKWGQGQRMDAVVEKLKSNEKQLQERKSLDQRQWYVNTQKQTFVVVDATGPRAEFLIGSTPASDPDRSANELQQRRHIGRRFAVSAHEVTKSQFEIIRREHPGDFVDMSDKVKKFVTTEDSPQLAIWWFEAAAYCNFLSEVEGIPKPQWCYEPNKEGKYLAGMKAKDKFWELTGYRLPTEAEWEYACRAGTLTSRYFGPSEKLLPEYAWYAANAKDQTHPVGSVKPNDLGLFDMLGNVDEWCFDIFEGDRTKIKSIEDLPTTLPIEKDVERVLKGGAFEFLPRIVRSAYRAPNGPSYRSVFIGLRPVRSYP